MRPPHGTFEPAQTVDPGGVIDDMGHPYDPRATLRLAVGRDGRAVLMWGQAMTQCCVRKRSRCGSRPRPRPEASARRSP